VATAIPVRAHRPEPRAAHPHQAGLLLPGPDRYLAHLPLGLEARRGKSSLIWWGGRRESPHHVDARKAAERPIGGYQRD
jgi:hypothetical protein